MKFLLSTVTIIIFISSAANGQINRSAAEIIRDVTPNQTDTSINHDKLDSLDRYLLILNNNTLSDTTIALKLKLDSVLQSMMSAVDSLRQMCRRNNSNAQSLVNRYLMLTDSITNNNLDANQYVAKLDSLNEKMTNLQNDFNRKVLNIKQKATEKINSMELPIELKKEATRITQSIEALQTQVLKNMPSQIMNLDIVNNQNKLQLPDGVTNLSQNIQQLSDGSLKITDQSINPIKNVDGIGSVSGSVGGIKDDAAKITSLEPSTLEQTAETKFKSLDRVQDISKQTSGIPTMQSEEQAKTMLKEEAHQVAIDHFAGKEKELNEAMTTLAKYKSKYSSINGLNDVKKMSKNIMKGKPLLERIVPGIFMQLLKTNNSISIDLNPYVGYRFAGRITAGTGWNQRVVYNFRTNAFNHAPQIFGPRLFGEFKIGRGFSTRLELETMHTQIPPAFINPLQDPDHSEWVWGIFTGIKKEYNLYKKIKGTASVMARLLDPNNKSPYSEVINARFGFEIPMTKNVRRK